MEMMLQETEWITWRTYQQETSIETSEKVAFQLISEDKENSQNMEKAMLAEGPVNRRQG